MYLSKIKLSKEIHKRAFQQCYSLSVCNLNTDCRVLHTYACITEQRPNEVSVNVVIKLFYIVLQHLMS